MRKPLLLIISIIILISCSQEVENPIADYCWPVVHCLLDADDSVHYLRLGKTFSGTAVKEMIHNEDSLYFKEANVYFDIYHGDFISETIQLEAVKDMERDPGIFPATPFLLYKTDYPIKPGGIGLRIEIPELNRYVKAGIAVRGRPYFSSPPAWTKIIDFSKDGSVRITWNGYEHVRKTTIRLWYLEFTENGTDTCKLDWTREHSDFLLLRNDLLNYMLYWIKEDMQVLARRVLWVDILASGGNYQWYDYMDKKDVVFDLIGRPYSNLTGAYGFVGSRANGGIFKYVLDNQFLDSLAYLPRMAGLKFIHL